MRTFVSVPFLMGNLYPVSELEVEESKASILGLPHLGQTFCP